MKILAIGAHPDDVEFYCGGTLAVYSGNGHEIIMAHISNGDKGNMHIMPEEMAEIRRKESENAGALINAKVISAELRDAELEENLQNRTIIIDIIRLADPDVIITHYPEDYHADHRIVSRLVIDASFMASVPHITTTAAAIHKVPQIYFMETYTGINFQPQEYVDITDTFDTKMEIAKKHHSQIEWVKSHDNVDILDYLHITSRFRGFQCGVKYAEGFIRYIAALRAAPGRFLP